MMRAIVLVALLVTPAACSPRMHRAYQVAMASAASGLFMMDGAQTVAAIRSDATMVEGNPVVATMFGPRPPAAATWAIAGVQAVGAQSIILIPAHGDERVEYVKDFALTALVAIEAMTVWENADMRGLSIASSWR